MDGSVRICSAVSSSLDMKILSFISLPTDAAGLDIRMKISFRKHLCGQSFIKQLLVGRCDGETLVMQEIGGNFSVEILTAKIVCPALHLPPGLIEMTQFHVKVQRTYPTFWYIEQADFNTIILESFSL